MDYVNLIIALILFSVAVSASRTGRDVKAMKKAIEMQYFNHVEGLTKDYFVKCQKNCLECFKMGFEDGKSGSIPKVPPLPPMQDDQRANALCLLAQSFYRDGFAAGSGIKAVK